MQHMVAVETGEVLPLAAGADGAGDGAAAAEESGVGTDKRRRENMRKMLYLFFLDFIFELTTTYYFWQGCNVCL